MDKKYLRNIIQITGILAGSTLFAMAYSWFLIPYNVQSTHRLHFRPGTWVTDLTFYLQQN